MNSTVILGPKVFYQCLNDTCPNGKSLLLENFVCTEYDIDAKCNNPNSFLLNVTVPAPINIAYFCIQQCYAGNPLVYSCPVTNQNCSDDYSLLNDEYGNCQYSYSCYGPDRAWF